jgi:hypothetical protein
MGVYFTKVGRIFVSSIKREMYALRMKVYSSAVNIEFALHLLINENGSGEAFTESICKIKAIQRMLRPYGTINEP